MPRPLIFTIAQRCRESAARVGRIDTPHGSFDTPAFMPVGTKASIKGLTPDHIRSTGSQIILNNAYHLMLRPGDDLIARRGGVHKFMRWDGPILTDSGGYQAFSMSDINSIDDDGVTFASIIDGAKIHLGPERAMEVQNNLGADIIMAFDDCPPSGEKSTSRKIDKSTDASDEHNRLSLSNDHLARLRQANVRTIRWLERCKKSHARPDEQALFGIVQGGTDEELRRESAQAICNIDLPGYAIGGVAVGESTAMIRKVVEFTSPLLPADKPRYLMGVGYEHDIVMAVRAGIDMFDCVLPTRNGRNGNVFTQTGRLHLRNSIFREDDGVLEQGCDCLTCQTGMSRAYLRHLFMADEMLGPILASIHNIRHYQRLLLDIRRAIREDAWSSFHRSWPVASLADPGPVEGVFNAGQVPDAPGIAGLDDRDV
jgi:queuine tRNA-ribosyltransferase